jgi:formate dehydrogenase subunit delta
VAGIAEHIKKFWDPRMRAAIFAHLEDGGAGLDPVVRTALERLAGAKTEATEQKAQH